MRHLDLFSGIGGFSLAAQWVWGRDHEIVSFVEKDEFCQKVLKKHWPEVPIHDNIKDFTYEGKERIDLLTGGFPCQPFSVAGKRRGKEDDRYLWPEMLRVIREARPNWIVGENVAGFISLGLETSVADLETEGYEVEIFILPACCVGAKHKRDRVWIVANSKCLPRAQFGEAGRMGGDREPIQGDGYWEETDQPSVCWVVDGIPTRMDRSLRKKGLRGFGNAIVPQVAHQIMLAIKHVEEVLCSR